MTGEPNATFNEDRLERLFEEASTLPLVQRAAFLREACGADEDLRIKLGALLTDAAEAHDFSDRVVGRPLHERPASSSAIHAMMTTTT